jgi:hypothetical protein
MEAKSYRSFKIQNTELDYKMIAINVFATTVN